MSVSQDLTAQLNLGIQQGSQNPLPNTIVAATTIAPSYFLTNISGTTNIATITPPISGAHMLCLNFTNGSPGSLLTTGNILVGITTIAHNRPILVMYDPNQAKYLVGPVS
jgi:hypothetical protein